MKKLLIVISSGLMLMLTGCIKNDIATYTNQTIEWDAAAWNANTSPFTYPMMTRVPIFGFATGTSAPSLTRASGTIRLRVNLVGAQAATDRTFAYQFSQSESTAAPGTHFEAVSGKGSIAANSSYGYVDLKILNPGPSVGTATIVLQLVNNESFKASVNYAKIGLSVAQN